MIIIVKMMIIIVNKIIVKLMIIVVKNIIVN